MAGILLYLCWEASLITISIFICKKIIFKNYSAQSYLLVFVLGLKILSTSCLMYVLVYLHVIELLVPITILMVSAIIFSLFRSKTKLKNYVTSRLKIKNRIQVIRLISVFVCLASLSISPLIETDSNFASNWMMNYLNNSGSIFEFAWNYSAHWEVNYLPGLYFTNSWLIIFVKNFEVIGILYVLIKNIASALSPSRKPNEAIVLAVMSIPLLWLNAPTGFATLKNDQIYASGILMITIAVIQLISNKKFSFAELMLLTMGFIFVLVKFSGPLLIILVAVFLFWFVKRYDLSIKDFELELRRIFILFGPISLFYVLPYLYNLIFYRSPLYPVQLSVFGFDLPGYFNTKNTRILEHLDNSETWLALIGVPQFPYAFAGLIFIPVVLFSPVFLFHKWSKKKFTKTMVSIPVAKNLVIISLILILLYFITPFSSGTKELPIVYLTSQNTLRYIIAPILILTLLAFLKMSERIYSVKLLNTLCVIFTVSNCLTIMKFNALKTHLIIDIAIVTFLSYALFMDENFINSNRKWIKKFALFLFIPSFVFSVNNIHKTYESDFYSVSKYKIQGTIANLVVPIPPQPDLSIVISGYCATGSKFNAVRYVGSIRVEQLVNISNQPNYLAVCAFPWQKMSPEIEDFVSKVLNQYGYTLFASSNNRLIYRRD